MIERPPMKETEPLYVKYGLSNDQWSAVAYLTDRVEKAGVKVVDIWCLRSGDPKAGAELLYGRGDLAIVLGIASKTGKASLAFYRGLDTAYPERVVQGDLSAWDSLASQMLYFR
jgi:hypothetical protein